MHFSRHLLGVLEIGWECLMVVAVQLEECVEDVCMSGSYVLFYIYLSIYEILKSEYIL